MIDMYVYSFVIHLHFSKILLFCHSLKLPQGVNLILPSIKLN